MARMARKIPLIWKVSTLVLVWRIALLLVAKGAASILAYLPSFPYSSELLASTHLPAWVYSWANFDGVHYLTIAQRGYHAASSIQAFFPVFPFILSVLGHPLPLGLIMNGLFVILALFLFFQLMHLDKNTTVSWWAILCLLAFPTSFFLGGLYSEPLFLCLVFGSFLAARKQHWWLAAALAGIASGTRIVGIALWPALCLELWLQSGKPSFSQFMTQKRKNLLIIFLAVSGLVAYMWYLYREFSDPLLFLHVQEDFGSGRQDSFILFPQVIWRYVRILWTARPIDWKYFSYAQDLFLSLGVLGILLRWYKKIRPSYLLFSLIVFFVPTLTGTLSSMPRYVLACFPIFFLLGEWLSKKHALHLLLLTVSLILLIINTMLFIQGYWVA